MNKIINKVFIQNKKYWQHLLSRILISLIFLFSILIYSSNNNDIKKLLFQKTISFYKFKNLYDKIGGTSKETSTVFGDNYNLSNSVKYYNGYKVDLDEHLIKSFASGIVVYIGKEDNFNNTVIVQGSNGYDIWYGNLKNINVSIYDYLNADDLVGEVNNSLYYVITKDNKYYSYEEYQNSV